VVLLGRIAFRRVTDSQGHLVFTPAETEDYSLKNRRPISVPEVQVKSQERLKIQTAWSSMGSLTCAV